MEKQSPFTCNQVLVLVDVELDSAQTLRGVRVDVLHMMDLFEPFVHLKDNGNKIRSARSDSASTYRPRCEAVAPRLRLRPKFSTASVLPVPPTLQKTRLQCASHLATDRVRSSITSVQPPLHLLSLCAHRQQSAFALRNSVISSS